MLFDKDKFINEVEKWFFRVKKTKFNGQQGLREVLSFIEADDEWHDTRQVANFLAQCGHESAWTYKPIKEFRAREGTTARRVQDKYWFTNFFGRGLVQITHRYNYEKLGKRLNIPLAENPEMALQPIYSYEIAAVGMREGLFTGKKLSDYINDTKCDYYSARKIVNGLDRASLIQGYSIAFERIIKSCIVDEFNSPINETEAESEESISGNNLVGTRQEDTAIQVDEVAAGKVSGMKNWWATVTGTISSLGISAASVWSAVSGLFGNEGFTKILLLIGLVSLVFAGLFGLTYLILRAVGTAREHQRAHELTMKQLEIRANPQLYNVEVVKRDTK